MENPCWCNNTDAEADDVAVTVYGEPIVMLGLLWYKKIKNGKIKSQRQKFTFGSENHVLPGTSHSNFFIIF